MIILPVFYSLVFPQSSGDSTCFPIENSSLLQPIHSPLKNLAKKQKREKIQYRKWTMGAAKMRSSIFCVRDDLSIFYIVFFLFSSVLNNLFSGRPVCLRKLEFLRTICF